MKFEEFKEEFDRNMLTMTAEEMILLLEKAGCKFPKKDCDICHGIGYIQPEGQNAKMYCWKCH